MDWPPYSQIMKPLTKCLLYTVVGLTIGAFCISLSMTTYRSYYDNPRIYGVLWHQWEDAFQNNTYVWQQPQPVVITEVTFVVMASSVNMQRHVSQRLTWMRHIPHIYAFSDADTTYTMTLPELVGKTTWLDAQHRQLRGMQWLLRQDTPLTRWYVLVDDDTWVHVPMLLTYLGLLQHNKSLISGYRHKSGVFNGGAGIVLSQRAFQRIARALYTPQCPIEVTNDNTVSHCAERLGAFTFIHSTLFSFYPSWITAADDFIDKVSVHPVKDAVLMREMTREIEKHFQ